MMGTASAWYFGHTSPENQAQVGKAPIGEAPVGKTPIGKAPLVTKG